MCLRSTARSTESAWGSRCRLMALETDALVAPGASAAPGGEATGHMGHTAQDLAAGDSARDSLARGSLPGVALLRRAMRTRSMRAPSLLATTNCQPLYVKRSPTSGRCPASDDR